ncbi:MAG: DNA primase [Nanoarchaeota archaeon]|nr:DNA primase [Nanoarchaeota archaeon]
MGKVSQVSSKYIIHARIEVSGLVEKPDVIGAIFGQTEGLLGAELELRELQKSGRIGRIDVSLKSGNGKSFGVITVPSSLDQAETSLVGAALETIERIGPCDAKIKVEKVEDVRINKRQFIIDRAKDLLKKMVSSEMPDSHAITDNVKKSVRAMGIVAYGPEKLPAGPFVDVMDELFLVEGRADVITMLRNGFMNVIALNGTSIPKTIVGLCKTKITTLFIDGDRGGKIILKELLAQTKVDFVAVAPDGKEVEELTKKEVHIAIRGKQKANEFVGGRPARFQKTDARVRPIRKPSIEPALYKKFKKMLESLVGTKAAYILDKELAILGKVPVKELEATLKNVDNAFAVVFDGEINFSIVQTSEIRRIKFLIGMRGEGRSRKVKIFNGKSFKIFES